MSKCDRCDGSRDHGKKDIDKCDDKCGKCECKDKECICDWDTIKFLGCKCGAIKPFKKRY